MKIGVIGASGKAGTLIMQEALKRGHEVTAVVRNASKITEQNVSVLESDVFDLSSSDLTDFDVVVNAFGAPMGEEHLHVDAGNILINALKDAPDTRLIVVGGAGSLYVDEAKTTRLFETPDFPDFVIPTSENQAKNLEILQATDSIKWTFISPSAVLDPDGKRTGSYQKGNDHLLVNSKGESYVSYADFAIAVLDEIENPQHVNERFTVVSENE
ncbi:NAD(P)-dependent oxidoreductase [Bacillus sp. V59.32b]|uniref:NAD(P)-dependent oxidoreductase n=1 Tax=Bacillus sp. V59.32b TaxID=1758642 RepID=UPI000E3DD3B2|nr:NAD(P)-dependent oxidoreductase [Bacillus sp. V59.32b]RFU66515.1 NAD(P)-dependent oxidoreductase [Bacillus sp. V59.32b]